MRMDKVFVPGFESVCRVEDSKSGLKAFIAIHSTALGPAVGGLRAWKYADEDAALKDVLKLAEGMTYKAALAGLPWGGGKAVLFGEKSTAALERFGDVLEILKGKYITAKDVGIGAQDLASIKRKTSHILGVEGTPGSSGDPSPATAYGVYHGIRASVQRALEAKSLSGVKIAVQGLGGVAFSLLGHLISDGAVISACDVSAQAVERVRAKFGDMVDIVSPTRILDVSCDVFAPSALGGVISNEVAENLRAKVVAGAANNQLAGVNSGLILAKRRILYAPDYVINAGGLINIYHETLATGYSRELANGRIRSIVPTLESIYDKSFDQALPTAAVADEIARSILAKAREKCV
jgi:leucine dehydrogenase